MNLRPVTVNDYALLLRWRNDPETRRWSFTGEPVRPDEHLAWLDAILANVNIRAYIGEVAGRPVGTVRFQRRVGGVAEVSIVVAPEAWGHGMGTELLQLGCERVLSDSWGVTQIEAHVKPDNLRSLALFRRVGFRDKALLLVFP